MPSIVPAPHKTQILVVEDEFLIREMICDALEDCGFETIGVAAAEDALGLALMEVPFDLLFTDIDLGGPMNGWELAETLREMRPNLPVAYTSGGIVRDRSLMVAGGIFFPKPYGIDRVCAQVEEMCRTAMNASFSRAPQSAAYSARALAPA